MHIYDIPQGHCANGLQPVLLSAISMYVSGLFWPYKTKQNESKQGKASCCVTQTRQEGCPLILKSAVWTNDSKNLIETFAKSEISLPVNRASVLPTPR